MYLTVLNCTPISQTECNLMYYVALFLTKKLDFFFMNGYYFLLYFVQSKQYLFVAFKISNLSRHIFPFNKEEAPAAPKMLVLPRGNCIQAQKSTKNIWQSFSNAMLFLLLNKLSKLFVEFNYDVFEKKLLTNNLLTFLLTLMHFNALI